MTYLVYQYTIYVAVGRNPTHFNPSTLPLPTLYLTPPNPQTRVHEGRIKSIEEKEKKVSEG